MLSSARVGAVATPAPTTMCWQAPFARARGTRCPREVHVDTATSVAGSRLLPNACQPCCIVMGEHADGGSPVVWPRYAEPSCFTRRIVRGSAVRHQPVGAPLGVTIDGLRVDDGDTEVAGVSGQYYETCSCDFVCPCIPGGMVVKPTKGWCTFANGV
jgi:hypothetical protein